MLTCGSCRARHVTVPLPACLVLCVHGDLRLRVCRLQGLPPESSTRRSAGSLGFQFECSGFCLYVLPRPVVYRDTPPRPFFFMKATVLSGNIRSYARRFITEIFHQYCRWIPCCYCSSSTSLYPSSARRSLGRGGCQGFMRSPVGSKKSGESAQ